MLLFIHIILALGSVVTSVSGSFKTTLFLAIGAVLSGVILTVQSPNHLTQSCYFGLIYLATLTVLNYRAILPHLPEKAVKFLS